MKLNNAQLKLLINLVLDGHNHYAYSAQEEQNIIKCLKHQMEHKYVLKSIEELKKEGWLINYSEGYIIKSHGLHQGNCINYHCYGRLALTQEFDADADYLFNKVPV